MTYTPIGSFDEKKAGHTEHYFAQRHTFIDYRGDLRISPESFMGIGNTIITTSHDVIRTGSFTGVMVEKRVWIDEFAWVTSACILYNCWIQHHAIVSVGSVVCNMEVPPYHVVEGNPARLVRWYDIENKRWRRYDG